MVLIDIGLAIVGELDRGINSFWGKLQHLGSQKYPWSTSF
jgi:hypothetical protein